jgi:ABC-type lipopolysaccharide export system ATPase subunit
MTVLSLRNLIKTYRGRQVVDDVSLDLESGAVVGPWAPTAPAKPRPSI